MKQQDSLQDARLSELLDKAQAGDVGALGALFEVLRPLLITFSQRELDADLQAKGGASDLVQQSFLEAHRDFEAFQGSTPEQLAKWLQTILRSNIADFRRRFRGAAKRRVNRELPLRGLGSDPLRDLAAADQETPSAHARREERDEQLDQALLRLPEQYRTAILLRHQENLSFAEIGQRMDRTSEAARKCWARAVQRLQQELEGDLSEG